MKTITLDYGQYELLVKRAEKKAWEVVVGTQWPYWYFMSKPELKIYNRSEQIRKNYEIELERYIKSIRIYRFVLWILVSFIILSIIKFVIYG